MDNLYKDLKPCLNELENQPNENSQNKSNSFTKSGFKFNINAAEFVPRFAIATNQSTSQVQNVGTSNFYKSAEYDQNFPNLGNGFQSGGQQQNLEPNKENNEIIELSNEVLKEDDYYALNELNNFIENISKNPALYEANVQFETDVLNNWILEEDPDIILECVVNNIMDQAIMDSNFRYNGVRFCLHLISNLHVTSSKGSFKQVLLQRCKREHSRREALKDASDNGQYLRGLTFFIGELSTKLNESDLILAVPDLLKTLLQNKSSDNVKCCCQILKLCGKSLTEFLTNKNSIEILDSLFNELNQLADKPDVEKSVRNLINYTVELYKNNWIAPLSSAPLFNPYAKGNLNGNNQMVNNQLNQVNEVNNQFDEYVDYGNGGYDFGPCGDDNNEDVCDAFEEFLKASGQM